MSTSSEPSANPPSPVTNKRGLRDDQLQESPSEDSRWDELLDRALAFGIRSKEQLCFEADVGHMSDIGSRLSDHSPGRQNVDLWAILLVAQALQHGHDGIKAVWRGMKFRGKGFRFEGEDSRVNALWNTFLSAGADDTEFLWALCKEVKFSRFNRPALFAEVVGAALEGSAPAEAANFATFTKEFYYRGHQDLVSVFAAACRSENADALKGFCGVYDVLPEARIYAHVTSSLWEHGRATDAFMMHSFLVSKKDIPPSFESLEPFINYLALQNDKLDRFLAPLNFAGISFSAQARRLWSVARSRITGVPTESLNIVASKTLGLAPNKISDQLVARAFATQGFSFEFAVNSLRLVGLIEVGPLAIRQMALTAHDLTTLQGRFQKLRELDIDLGSSSFGRILRNVCEAGRWEMVQALANSDLHHEVFEDSELQKRLLKEYYLSKDWKQLNRTLAILNDGRFDHDSQARSANLLLRTMVEVADWPAAITLATNVQVHGATISSALPRVISAIFRDTKESTLSHSQDTDQVAFLIGMLQNTLASGNHVPLRDWRGPLKALGRMGRLTEVECLVYWIAEWYKPMGLNQRVLSRPLHGKACDLNVLFDEKFQKSLMSWCFRPHKGMSKVSAERCLRWTRMLKILRDRYGVEVKEYIIRWAFIMRLRRLFVTEMRLKGHNTWMRARNRTSLARYWELYDQMWDMKPAGQVNYDDRVKASLYHRKLPAHRISKSLVGLQAPTKGKTPVKADARDDWGHENSEGNVVAYRDLFNASWEDYR